MCLKTTRTLVFFVIAAISTSLVPCDAADWSGATIAGAAVGLVAGVVFVGAACEARTVKAKDLGCGLDSFSAPGSILVLNDARDVLALPNDHLTELEPVVGWDLLDGIRGQVPHQQELRAAKGAVHLIGCSARSRSCSPASVADRDNPVAYFLVDRDILSIRSVHIEQCDAAEQDEYAEDQTSPE